MKSRARHAGLTLLELLVSMAILAAIVTLTAAIWAQARAWADEADGHSGAAETSRIRLLLQQQWSMRRQNAHLDAAEGPPFRLSPDRLEFVTGSAILEPESGLVRAAYIVETSDGGVQSVMYEEIPLTDPALSIRPGAGTAAAQSIRRVTLLTECSDVRWERLLQWTESADDGVIPETLREWTDAAPPEESQETAVMSDDLSKSEVAYRLAGRVDGRWFAWALVGADSR
jgi:prepilin-type N-terminal cleavage/methylation domain-containing protein